MPRYKKEDPDDQFSDEEFTNENQFLIPTKKTLVSKTQTNNFSSRISQNSPSPSYDPGSLSLQSLTDDTPLPSDIENDENA